MDDRDLVRSSVFAAMRAFDSRTVNRGREYWKSRRVSPLEEGQRDHDLLVSAAVQGTRQRPYDVRIRMRVADRRILSVFGDCTCPMVADCKHVVAVLLAFAESPSEPLPPRQIPEATPEVSSRLTPALSHWVESLGHIEDDTSEEYPATVRDRLVYVLVPDEYGKDSRLRLKPMRTSLRTSLRKDGEYSKSAKFYNAENVFQPTVGRFIRPSDRAILGQLAVLSRYASLRGYSLRGEDGAATLEAVLATGRVRWKDVKGPVLERGAPKRAVPRWGLGDDAAQHVRLELEDGAHLPTFALAPPWYVDIPNGVLGPVETGLHPRVAEAIRSAPPVPPGAEQELASALAQHGADLASFSPPALPPVERLGGPLVPRLVLTEGEPQWYRLSPGPVPVAHLSYQYGPPELGIELGRHGPVRVRMVGAGDRIVEVERDEDTEDRAEDRLKELGFALSPAWKVDGFGGSDDLRLAEPGGDRWLNFLAKDVPALRSEGWDVEVDPDFPIRFALADGPIEAHLDESTGIDWFDLDLGVDVDGERVDLVAPLVGFIASHHRELTADEPPAEDEMRYLTLEDGRVLALPAPRLWCMANVLRELFGVGVRRDVGPLRLSAAHAAELAAVEEMTAADVIAWSGGERLRALGARLRATGGVGEAEPPPTFRATLRPYQRQGVAWLQLLRSAGLGGILADEMGLGKTVQTLAHLSLEYEGEREGGAEHPSLIVAPTSVAAVWRDEAARFAPELRVLFLTGPERRDRFPEIGAHDVVITTYALLARDSDVLLERDWHIVVLDEAHAIKNPNAAVSRTAHGLRAQQRLCLTGTPVENHLGDLWSICTFAVPGLLPDRRTFQQVWRRPIERDGDRERERLLSRRLRPFLLRRTKSEVAQELPPRTEMVEFVEMAPAQRDLYESVRLAMHERVRHAIADRGLSRSHIVILDALLKLRQVCCDPRLVRMDTPTTVRARSAKLDRLLELLTELVEDGRRILLFSQFTSMLALIQEALQRDGIPYVLLTGDTRDRETPVRTFQRGEVPLFLISLKAGGTGLNLTAADTVIHYDPWWNPAVEEQATGRAHRIGQEKPIFVSRLIVRGSIEEKMERLKDRKRALASGIFDPDGGSSLDLTEGDVEELFARG